MSKPDKAQPKRSKVYLEIYQLAELYPDDLGYRIKCRLCGWAHRWMDDEAGLDQFADHLRAKHRAHGGKRLASKGAKSTVT